MGNLVEAGQSEPERGAITEYAGIAKNVIGFMRKAPAAIGGFAVNVAKELWTSGEDERVHQLGSMATVSTLPVSSGDFAARTQRAVKRRQEESDRYSLHSQLERVRSEQELPEDVSAERRAPGFGRTAHEKAQFRAREEVVKRITQPQG